MALSATLRKEMGIVLLLRPADTVSFLRPTVEVRPNRAHEEGVEPLQRTVTIEATQGQGFLNTSSNWCTARGRVYRRRRDRQERWNLATATPRPGEVTVPLCLATVGVVWWLRHSRCKVTILRIHHSGGKGMVPPRLWQATTPLWLSKVTALLRLCRLQYPSGRSGANSLEVG